MDTTLLTSRWGTSSLSSHSLHEPRGRFASGTANAFADRLDEYALPDWWRLDDTDAPQPDALVSLNSTTGATGAHQTLAAQATTAWATDFELELLADAAQYGDEERFAIMSDQIDWRNRGPDALALGIRYALHVGAHSIAHKLALIARDQYRGDEGLQKFIQVLAPARIERAALPTNDSAAADMRWLKAHRDEFRGQWVALKDGVLLATAETWKELLTGLENPKDKSILVTLVY